MKKFRKSKHINDSPAEEIKKNFHQPDFVESDLNISGKSHRKNYRKYKVFAVIIIMLAAFKTWTLAPVIYRSTTHPLVKIEKINNISLEPKINTPVRILLLGSDSRNNSIAGSRSDAIVVLQINKDKSADLVAIPRDSYVNIPGHGSRKINSAMAIGGPELTVKTIEQLTGLKFDYYLVTTFPGFLSLINNLKGLQINIDRGVHDPYSGANLDAGPQKIGSGQALAFARARHHVLNDDFGRADHHLDIAEAAFLQERARRKTAIERSKLIPVMLKYIDTNLSAFELSGLIKTVLCVNPKKVNKTVLKGSNSRAGRASIVLLDKDFTNEVFDKLSEKK